jgi:hypothetical protein
MYHIGQAIDVKKKRNVRKTEAKDDEPESFKIQIKRHSVIGSAKIQYSVYRYG